MEKITLPVVWRAFCFDGQMTDAPLGGSMLEFYEKFAAAVAKAPILPDWIWCLTARVRDENRIGEDHRLVHGTRHFAPGTKVYLHPPNWDERVAAIGVPRYSSKRTRVGLRTASNGWTDSTQMGNAGRECCHANIGATLTAQA